MKISLYKLLPVAAVALSACASHVTQISDTNGNPAKLIECRRNMGNCYEAANAECPGGYRTLSETQASGGGALVGGSNGIYGAAGVDRRIVVACK